MPGTYGVVWRGEDERGKGGRQPSPFAVGGGCRSRFTAFSTPCQTR